MIQPLGEFPPDYSLNSVSFSMTRVYCRAHNNGRLYNLQLSRNCEMHMGGRGWWSYISHDEKQDQPEVSWALVRRVARYGRPYLWRIAGVLATILIITLLSLIPPLLYRDLIDNALANNDAGRLNLLALGMIGVPLVNGLLGVFQRYLSTIVGEGIIFSLRTELFSHLQSMSLRFFTNSKTGEIMSRLNNDVVGAQQAITGTIVSLVSNVVALVAVLTIMLSLEWRLTLVSIAILPLFIYPARHIGNLLRRLVREQMNLNAQMNSLMNETLNVSGALLVKLFGRTTTEDRRFAERAAKVRDIGIRQSLIGRWFFMGLSVVSAIGTAVVFWMGGHLVLSGEFTIGTIVAFGAYLTQLYGPLSSLTNTRVQFATSLVSFERVFEVLDLPVDIYERPDAKKPATVQGRVRFDNVWFGYNAKEDANGPVVFGLRDVERFSWGGQGRSVSLDEGDGGTPRRRKRTEETQTQAEESDRPRWALQEVSFEVRPGQLAAIVGPSGAGKTTTTYLLPRLYDPTRGRVLMDEYDLRDLTLKSLSDTIGMVTQETYLFHDTIRSNLLYAKSDASEQELDAACRAANIHDFIQTLPERYDTVVGERGYRLSGGEKQRVAIARVILKDPRILVLDEATSHLDSESEALIQEALKRVMEGRTSVVIAHRLSTILAADVILVLDQGKLVEQGNHAELVEQAGLYSRLYKTQFRSIVGDSAGAGAVAGGQSIESS